MSYKIKTDIFEGPFDLLVYLIENAKMSIYDINISEITNKYLEYIAIMREEAEPDTEFLVLAAILIEIKSKMLLPGRETIEGIIPEEDPAAQLMEKLLEYKKFKCAATYFEKKEEAQLLIYEKPKEDLSVYTGETDEYMNLSIKQFVAAFDMFLRKKQKIEEVRKHYTRVERQRQNVEEKIEYILSIFRKVTEKKITFRELLKGESDTYDVVLTFFTMLEMIKQRTVKAEQRKAFGEIEIEKTEAEVSE